MESLLRELRYAFRSIGKTPGTSLVAVIALALGIGLTTIMFSIVYGALVRGLPFDGQEDLIGLAMANLSRGVTRNPIIVQDFIEFRDRQRSFEAIAGYNNTSLNLGVDGATAIRVRGAQMDPSMFRILRVQPAIGRVFTEQ